MACSIIVKQTLGHRSERNQNGCAGAFSLPHTFFQFSSRVNAERSAYVSHDTESREFNSPSALS